MQTDYTTKSQAGAEPLPDAVQGISCSNGPNAAGKSLHSRLLDWCPRIIHLLSDCFLADYVSDASNKAVAAGF
jgi:hypothetical protein